MQTLACLAVGELFFGTVRGYSIAGGCVSGEGDCVSDICGCAGTRG
jgi:hypothetical protein